MNTRRRRIAGLAAALSIVAAIQIVGATPASANGNGQWSVQPTGADGVTPRDWFEYQLRPGQTIRDLVSVSNLTDHDMTFAIYPADAFNTPVDAAFALNLKSEPSTDEGRWIHIGYDTYTVPPQSRADLPFEIQVPPDAAPGDHAAGIVAEDTTTHSAVEQGKGVVLQQRVATRIYIRVAGPLQPSLQVTQIKHDADQALLPPFTGRGHDTITYEVTNTGNVRLQGKATLRINGLFGRSIKEFAPVDLPELLPKGSTVIQAQVDSLPIVDHVTAEVTVTAPGVKTVRSKAFWAIPWLEVLIILVAVGLVIGWRRYRRWRRERPDKPLQDPPNTAEEKEPALV